jgi:dTMP kinase
MDGSGKDTQLRLLARRFELNGITPITLHEPSYGQFGRALRARLSEFPNDVATQRALFTQDRTDHFENKIAPALAFVERHPGFVLLQNRSVVSAAAYQPLGDGDAMLVLTIEQQTRIAPIPDLVLILDVSVDESMRRIVSRGVNDVFEREASLRQVRSRYLRLADIIPQCIMVDGEGPEAKVAERVQVAIRQAEGMRCHRSAEAGMSRHGRSIPAT